MSDSILPTWTGVTVVGVFLFDGIIDAIEGHTFGGSAEDRTANDCGKGVTRFGVTVRKTAERVGTARMNGVNFRGGRCGLMVRSGWNRIIVHGSRGREGVTMEDESWREILGPDLASVQTDKLGVANLVRSSEMAT